MERRHLVIVHEPGWSDLDDWRTIARHIADRAPDLRSYIVNNADENAMLRQMAARAPTLVVSPGPLRRFQPARGRVYAGRRVPKAEQLARLEACGVPVPRWRVLGPDEPFRADGWSSHVVAKPADGLASRGVGVQLFASADMDGAPLGPLVGPVEHGSGRLIVQDFVDSGPTLDYRRVLTLFGRALYAMTERLRQPLPLATDGAPVRGAPIANNGYARDARRFGFEVEPDALALAAACHEALPENPLKGIDMLRCRHTGRLMVIEINPGGNTWHFSSDHSRRRGIDPVFEAAKRDQFDAFSVAADVLIERTRAEAE